MLNGFSDATLVITPPGKVTDAPGRSAYILLTRILNVQWIHRSAPERNLR